MNESEEQAYAQGFDEGFASGANEREGSSVGVAIILVLVVLCVGGLGFALGRWFL